MLNTLLRLPAGLPRRTQATSPRKTVRPLRAGVAALPLALALTLGGCASSSAPESGAAGSAETASASAETAATAGEVPAEATIIDVRTPDEFEAGHLEGAQLLDLNGGQFDAEMSELDPAGTYNVYCRSGNRSATAVQKMRDAGFTGVTDLGSMDAAAQTTGIPVVQ